MAGQMTIEQMRQLIERLDQARASEGEGSIPQAYLDRLEKASQLLDEYRKLPKVDWDAIKTIEEIEKAEGMVHLKSELRFDIERHFNACSLTVRGGEKPARRVKETGRIRQIRRSKEQIEYDLKVAELYREKKAELKLPARGRITEDDKAKLDTAIERELKKQKITAPKA